jgi:hypothetical protein
MSNKPSKDEYAKFKALASDKSKPESFRKKFQNIVDKFAKDFEEVGGETEKEVKKVEKVVKKVVKKAVSTTKKALTKADILKKVGKTEKECEDILEQYKSLRSKATTRKKAETKAKDDNKKRVTKLKAEDKVIKGTTEKKATSTLETTATKIEDKVEKEIKKIEDDATKKVESEIKPIVEKQVAKDKTKTPTQQKAEVKKIVEVKVKEAVKKEVKKEGKKIVAKLEVDTKDIITSITTALGKHDKDLQKEFLIKLRSDIDKLLKKFMYGGLTDGASSVQNITQSQMSSSSVNFAEGGSMASGGEIMYLLKNYGYKGNRGDKIIVDSIDKKLGVVFGSPKDKSKMRDFQKTETFEYEISDISSITPNPKSNDGSTYAEGGNVVVYGKTKVINELRRSPLTKKGGNSHISSDGSEWQSFRFDTNKEKNQFISHLNDKDIKFEDKSSTYAEGGSMARGGGVDDKYEKFKQNLITRIQEDINKSKERADALKQSGNKEALSFENGYNNAHNTTLFDINELDYDYHNKYAKGGMTDKGKAWHVTGSVTNQDGDTFYINDKFKGSAFKDEDDAVEKSITIFERSGSGNVTESDLGADYIDLRYSKGGMTDRGYNGWTNYATWRVNLEMVDGVEWDEYNDGEPITKDLLESYVEEGLENYPELAISYANAFLNDVNYYEIAKHINEDYSLSDEDEFAKGGSMASGGEIGKLKKYEKQLWSVMQVKGQSRKVKSDTSKEIHRVQEKIKNLQSKGGSMASGGGIGRKEWEKQVIKEIPKNSDYDLVDAENIIGGYPDYFEFLSYWQDGKTPKETAIIVLDKLGGSTYALGGGVKPNIAYIDAIGSFGTNDDSWELVTNILKKHNIEVDNSKDWHTKGYAEELYEERDGTPIITIKLNMNDAPNPKKLKKEISNLPSRINYEFTNDYAKGGKLWLDTGKKGGTKGVKKSNRGSFRAKADARGLTSKQLAQKVIANPKRYKGIKEQSAHLVNAMVKRHGGGIMNADNQFTKKANQRGVSVEAFMQRVLSNPSKYDATTIKQARTLKNNS